jgi:hypothetical protein
VSAAALLAELHAAGVRLSLAGDDLRFQTRPGVSIAAYRERITASKPALVTVLRARQPVAPSRPPAGWDGIAPARCGVPSVCRALGPCPHFTAHGCCWAEEHRS